MWGTGAFLSVGFIFGLVLIVNCEDSTPIGFPNFLKTF